MRLFICFQRTFYIFLQELIRIYELEEEILDSISMKVY